MSIAMDVDADLEKPEALDDAAYETMIDRLGRDLSASGRTQLIERLSALKPSERSKDGEYARQWAGLAEKPGARTEYRKHLAERLVDLACLAVGRPYVAAGLLKRSRFKDAGKFGMAAMGTLREAAVRKSADCPGAHDLSPEDFAEGRKRAGVEESE